MEPKENLKARKKAKLLLKKALKDFPKIVALERKASLREKAIVRKFKKAKIKLFI